MGPVEVHDLFLLLWTCVLSFSFTVALNLIPLVLFIVFVYLVVLYDRQRQTGDVSYASMGTSFVFYLFFLLGFALLIGFWDAWGIPKELVNEVLAKSAQSLEARSQCFTPNVDVSFKACERLVEVKLPGKDASTGGKHVVDLLKVFLTFVGTITKLAFFVGVFFIVFYWAFTNYNRMRALAQQQPQYSHVVVVAKTALGAFLVFLFTYVTLYSYKFLLGLDVFLMLENVLNCVVTVR